MSSILVGVTIKKHLFMQVLFYCKKLELALYVVFAFNSARQRNGDFIARGFYVFGNIVATIFEKRV